MWNQEGLLDFFARMIGSLGVPPSEIDNTKEEIDLLGEIRTHVWTCLILSLKKKMVSFVGDDF